MGREVKLRPRRGSRRLAVAAAAVASLIAGLALVASVLAATPKAGCWGTCGGDEGPVGGFFNVTGHKIVGGILIELKCLGTHRIALPAGQHAVVGDELAVPEFGYSPSGRPRQPSSILISKGGHFSYRGEAQRLQGNEQKSVEVDVSGEFLSSTRAQIRFAIAYGNCRSQVVRIPRAG